MVNTQHCPRCDQQLPLDAYHPSKRGKVGTYCRACAHDYGREWKRAHRPAPRPRRARPAKAAPELKPLSTTYRAVHRRVQRERGPASQQPCTRCPARAEHWAYDHADPHPLVGRTPRGIVAEYSTDASHYLPLCRSCHSRFDQRTITTTHVEPSPRLVTTW